MAVCPVPSPQDRDFLAKQKEDLELAMKRITADNRREICDKERECLTRKQELLRGGCPGAGRAAPAQSLPVDTQPPAGKSRWVVSILKLSVILHGGTWEKPPLRGGEARMLPVINPCDTVPPVGENEVTPSGRDL